MKPDRKAHDVQSFLLDLQHAGADVSAAWKALEPSELGGHHSPILAKLEGVLVRWNPRLKVCAGRAWPERKLIELNPLLCEEGLAAVRDTFLHELAHMLAGRGAGHGRCWQFIVRGLGGKAERCHEYAALRSRKLRVVAVCGKCGVELRRRRKLPRNRGQQWVHLPKRECGGRFEDVE